MARYGAERRVGHRSPLPLFIIVCDDRATAPAYFQANLQSNRDRVVRVSSAPRAAEGVVERAAAEMKELSDREGATVWALVALEMAPDSDRRMDALRKQASKTGIQLVLSQPCFEVWTLAHLEETGRLFKDCKAVVVALRAAWRKAFAQEFPRKKAQADYTKLRDWIDRAVGNAKSHTHRNSRSWTEVWRLVEQILAATATLTPPDSA